MAVKRRVIWLDDDQWAQLQAIAKERGDTVSAVIKDFWRVAADPAKYAGRIQPEEVADVPWPSSAGMPGAIHSFGTPRPAPKPGKGK